MTLSKEERDAIEQSGAVTLTVDGIRCVVLRADVYSALTNDLDHDELRAMLARSTQNGDWLDPSMDIYDDYDKHR